MNQKIKVGVLIDQLIPGGVQKIAADEVKRLNQKGFDAQLFILMRDGYKNKYNYLLKNVPHQFLQDNFPPLFKKNFKLPFFSFFSALHLLAPILAISQLKKHNLDIIISHGSTTSFTALSTKYFAKIPYIFMIHDPMVYILDKIYTKSPIYRFSAIIKLIATFVEKRIAKNAQTVVIDSNFHQKFIKKKYETDPQINHLGTTFKKPLTQLGNNILTTGRWGKGKNLQLLLEILPEFPSTSLIVAGIWSNNSDLTWFKNLIKQKNLQKRVRLITYYKDKDLVKIASLARVWVLPHQEAFSISALEAASLGLPIIIPKNSGVTDLLENQKNGIFLRRITKKSLSEALRIFIANKKTAQNFGKNASIKTRKFYSLTTHANKLFKLIENSLQKKPYDIIALEAGHVGKVGIAGGDVLLSKMVENLTIELKLSVIIPQDNTSHWHKLESKIKIITLKHTFLDEFTSAWLVLINYLFRIIRITPKLARSPKGTIIYSSTDTLPDVIPAFIAKILNSGYFWISRVHHLSPPPFKRPGNFLINAGSAFLQKISLNAIRSKADIILVLNDSLKKTLQNAHFPEDKLHILQGGVDYEEISKFKPTTKESYDAVYLGRIHATKGVFDLPPIWSIVIKNNPEAKLAVIGTGSKNNIEKFKHIVSKNNLSKNVFILDFIPQKRLWSILKNSKVFLFTDYEAGWGLAVAEAMAAGLPVVGWDIGILGVVFKKGFKKVRLGNFNDFAYSIIRLIAINKIQKELSTQAQKEAKKFAWSKTSQQFAKILDDV